MGEVSVYALALGQTEIFNLVLLAFSIGFWIAVVFFRLKLHYMGKLENRRRWIKIDLSLEVLGILLSAYFLVMGWYMFFTKEDYSRANFYMLVFLGGIISINERRKK